MVNALTPTELESLGQRVVKLRFFEWHPGMLSSFGSRCIGDKKWKHPSGHVVVGDPGGEIPDFSDAETIEGLRKCVEYVFDLAGEPYWAAKELGLEELVEVLERHSSFFS